jgi:hypothetical protein
MSAARGRLLLRLGTVPVTVALCALPAPTAFGQGEDSDYVLSRLDDRSDTAVVAGGDSAGISSAGQESVPGARVIVQVTWTPACAGSNPALAGILCPSATRLCPPAGNGAQIRMWRWTRQWDQVVGRAITAWQVAGAECVGPEIAGTPAVNLVLLRTFRDRVKLLAASLEIQPSNGRTLVNLDTIFYTENRSRTVTGIDILGRSVDLRLEAVAYRWSFGDGAATTTAGPGRPYPHKDVSHRYSAPGVVAPRVDVTYTGEYRVDGGRWLDVPGDATVTGPAVLLTVVEARSELVAG